VGESVVDGSSRACREVEDESSVLRLSSSREERKRAVTSSGFGLEDLRKRASMKARMGGRGAILFVGIGIRWNVA